ncbi:MAG: NAD-dependent epimerase/dehydratase family protein [Firmicutes bacterium]|nr:NAD-dependent epimerase/dehydratase family protein [Bacillota bacterium]
MRSVEELERVLATPSQALIDDLSRLTGDILILGAGGKMGPSLALLAQRAIVVAGLKKRVIAVARYTNSGLQQALVQAGVETIAADIMDERALAGLPDAANLIYMVGHKFGTVGQEPRTWAVNTFLPGLVTRRFAQARTVVFSTGNVYPFVPVASGGATEQTPVAPIGDYAQSCLGRERIFTHASLEQGTPVLLYRLNYAIDMRYGVLHEVARAVYENRAIDLRMGHVNVIWQGDANAMALRSLLHCSTPPQTLNVTGPETISIRALAAAFAQRMGRQVAFTGEESGTALLSNAGRAFGLFGYPTVTLEQMIDWTADWVSADRPSYGKPTRFEEREGRF